MDGNAMLLGYHNRIPASGDRVAQNLFFRFEHCSAPPEMPRC